MSARPGSPRALGRAAAARPVFGTKPVRHPPPARRALPAPEHGLEDLDGVGAPNVVLSRRYDVPVGRRDARAVGRAAAVKPVFGTKPAAAHLPFFYSFPSYLVRSELHQ